MNKEKLMKVFGVVMCIVAGVYGFMQYIEKEVITEIPKEEVVVDTLVPPVDTLVLDSVK